MFVMIYSSHIQAFRLETSECSTQIGDDGEACIHKASQFFLASAVAVTSKNEANHCTVAVEEILHAVV